MSATVRPWPADTIEHELRSLRAFLRRIDGCPLEVRLSTQEEGDFIRPSIVIRNLSLAIRTEGRNLFSFRRLSHLSWYGQEDATERDARWAASWITAHLTMGDGIYRVGGAIPVLDFSDTAMPMTGHAMEIDHTSVATEVMGDVYGVWMTAVDFAYDVRIGAGALQAALEFSNPSVSSERDLPVVTGIERIVTDIEHTEVIP